MDAGGGKRTIGFTTGFAFAAAFANGVDGPLTVLPGWCIPRALYTVLARQQALDSIAPGGSIQQAAPHCRDPDRLADASTIRRWAWRRLQSCRFWFSTTLLAFDFPAVARTLIAEAASP